jgi:hypothetical protein
VKLIWGREPAVFWNMVATFVMAVLLLFPVDEHLHGLLNAAALAAAGFATAAMVSVDVALPALTGLIKAVFAVVIAFGMNIPESTQVGILAIVAAAGAFFVRQQVVPKVAAAFPMQPRYED